ncbi:MAG: ferritin-like domain-containing protein [Myxococcales bacterium]|nr:ferritin-like domain-containing protein [Myxococcales bacterium]
MSRALTLQFDVSPLAREGYFKSKLAKAPVFEVPALRFDVAVLAQRAWVERARSEYVGVMIARKLWGLLVDVNAPRDVQELALCMVLDEQRHLSLCMAAAEALGARPRAVFEVADLQQARGAGSLSGELLEMVAGTYAVGEVVALRLVTHAIGALPPSGFRDVLRRIASDEVLHGRIGAALLRVARAGAEWLAWPGDEAVAAVGRRWVRAMRRRDVVEPDEVAAYGDPAAAAQLAAVGISDPQAFRAAYLGALVDDVPAAFASVGIVL